MKKVEIEQIPINNDLLNLITPQGIVLKYNKVQLGEITSKLQYVAGYPSTVNLGWLSNLKDIPNTIVSLTVTPIEDVQAYVDGVSKGITALRNTLNSTQNEAIRQMCEFKIASAERIIKDITVDNIPYINLSIIFKTNGETDQDFQNNVKLIKNRVAGMGLKARVPAYLQKEALKQSAPYDTSYKEITDISNKTMSLNALFSGLPFSRKWIN